MDAWACKLHYCLRASEHTSHVEQAPISGTVVLYRRSIGTNPTLELSGEDFIYYEGGGIKLSFEGDEQQGYAVVDAQAIAD